MSPMSPRLLRPRASGVFSPRSISGLSLWLDATQGVTVESGGVAAWADRSGNGRDFTQGTTAARPTYTATMNGRNVLSFLNGLTVERTGVSNATFGGTAGASWWVVFRATGLFAPGAPNSYNIAYLGGGTDGVDNFQNSQSYHAQFRASGFRAGQPSSPVFWSGLLNSGSHLFGQVVNVAANTHEYRRQMATRGTTTPAYSGWRAETNRTWTMGSGQLVGDIAETVLYDRPLNATEIAQVEGYLAWKWGLQSQLPYNHPYAASFPGFGSQTVPTDADALTYLAAVATADGGTGVEVGVANAVDDFVKGCKADGIWSAIKASCILSGARTLSGALTPLVGTAPTNVNFVSGDYIRKTGLARATGTKYLNTNRASNADPQNDYHASVYWSTFNVGQAQMGANDGSTVYDVRLYYSFGQWQCAARNNYAAGLTSQVQPVGALAVPALVGVRRASSASFRLRAAGTNYDFNIASAAPSALNTFVFASNNNGAAGDNGGSNRLTFYSIGESLDLALLDTRVSALYTAIGAAIP